MSRQTQEIGVRMALGAATADILKTLMGRGFRLLAAGIGIGLLGAAGAVRLLASRLTVVSPFEPWSMAAVAAPLLTAGLAASFVPANRAARVHPMQALRHD